MIVLDLDGTLLDDYKKVSAENIEMIKRAYEEKGVITVIATGRPLSFARGLSLDNGTFANYIIACNGAIINEIQTNEYIDKKILRNEEVLEIRKIFLEEEAEYMLMFSGESSICETSVEIDFKGLKKANSGNDMKYRSIEEVLAQEPDFDKFICIIGIVNKSEEILKKVMKRLENMPDIEVTDISTFMHKSEEGTFKSRFIDVAREGATKENAIKILAKKLGIMEEEIIVMGDGGNDMPMFDVAGLKVAMENAMDSLKEKADFITANNNENGVAVAIQKFVFD